MVKNPPPNAGDPGSIPGSGRSPGGGHGNPLQYSCLDNPMDRGAWWATVHGVTNSQTQLKQLSTHAPGLWPVAAEGVSLLPQRARLSVAHRLPIESTQPTRPIPPTPLCPNTSSCESLVCEASQGRVLICIPFLNCHRGLTMPRVVLTGLITRCWVEASSAHGEQHKSWLPRASC